jgi:glycosyltransferase involved in cell wall biosynthesis
MLIDLMGTDLEQAEQVTKQRPKFSVRRLSILIPVYNSQQTVGRLIDEVIANLSSRYAEIEIVLVNDGSVDGSHEVLNDAVSRHPGIVKYVRLARNFGEHNAVMCGLHYVSGDCVAIIDDDFQNPPDQIIGLVDKLQEGYDVVFSCYDEKHHSWFRNLGSAFNDRVATRLLKKPRGLYLSSFKVINRFLIDTVKSYDGPYPYLDGLILRSTSAIGQQLCQHSQRETGQSNYTLSRLIRLWLNMFTGFSVLPLRVASILGLVMSAAGFALAMLFMISWMFGGIFREGSIPPGWASLIVTITIFAGLQLCVLGTIGEYLGRVFQTMSGSPQFVIREILGTDQEKSNGSDHGEKPGKS